MRLSITFSAFLLALSQLVKGDSEQFGLISIRSGSALQYSFVYFDSDDGKFYVSASSNTTESESLVEAVITDKGRLQLEDGSYVYVDEDNVLRDTDKKKSADKGFSIIDGHLAYECEENFYVVPEGGKYVLSVGEVPSNSTAIGIVLRTADTTGSKVPDFAGSSDCSSCASGHEFPNPPSCNSTISGNYTEPEGEEEGEGEGEGEGEEGCDYEDDDKSKEEENSAAIIQKGSVFGVSIAAAAIAMLAFF
ncbi:hypothetical protein Kpol_1042p26 [Vanderwaltozyma polyspora DSM 70294]|uniref:Uncharacterized protein n=1 Tax=Vanderwaltozyma polyspora (strain ATCC 22028 / DSM 70294 / BCRC 21397 / CBS 2163 / NBRC 10782 / NRRL Y-8283 / UCD 57-17) TaxID=436907 RepID=A7TQB1_VANPO|nr:uncharacterized protein Kpol_1042p26 [Vanderwaltozyma polyspora DSM 70294]EDO15565.1 hypothetical protein Kpol_1042p26 [Vanderwaltozyma polyspora DSM 70294]